MRPHLTVEQRQLALQLKARGWSVREIGPQVDCAFQTVARITRRGSRRPVRLGAGPGAADPGGPGGDHSGLACRGVVHRDCRPGRQGGLDGCRGKWRPTVGGAPTGRGGPISVPASRTPRQGLGDPSQ
jgi:hypothetical protein